MQRQPNPHIPPPPAADAQTVPADAGGLARRRLDGIDCLRGLVMVLMALDHTRDYLAPGTALPRDVHDPALFLTRWITNFCAPTFVFLAGVSAFLYDRRVSSRARLSKFLVTYGRVPFFYYVAHLYLIHLVAVAVGILRHGETGWLIGGLPPLAKPLDWGFSLPVIYTHWLLIVLALYPLCRWYGRVKQSRRDWWLSYL